MATAFGAWAGIDPQRCNSTGHSNLNFLIKPVVSGVNSLTLRVKVKDAQGSYFYKDVTVQVNAWQRVTVNLGEMALESGATPSPIPSRWWISASRLLLPATALFISRTSSSGTI